MEGFNKRSTISWKEDLGLGGRGERRSQGEESRIRSALGKRYRSHVKKKESQVQSINNICSALSQLWNLNTTDDKGHFQQHSICQILTFTALEM